MSETCNVMSQNWPFFRNSFIVQNAALNRFRSIDIESSNFICVKQMFWWVGDKVCKHSGTFEVGIEMAKAAGQTGEKVWARVSQQRPNDGWQMAPNRLRVEYESALVTASTLSMTLFLCAIRVLASWIPIDTAYIYIPAEFGFNSWSRGLFSSEFLLIVYIYILVDNKLVYLDKANKWNICH